MPNFLSIRDVTERTGKSESTIRRLIRGIVKNEHHPDRPLIKPDPRAAQAMRRKGEQFAWTLSEDLVARAFTDAPHEPPEAHVDRPVRGRVNVLQILREELRTKEQHLQGVVDQLKVKDQQITRQSDIIEALNERLREGNLLMGSLQKQLQLKDGKREGGGEIIEAATVAASTLKRGKARQVKKRWWERRLW